MLAGPSSFNAAAAAAAVPRARAAAAAAAALAAVTVSVNAAAAVAAAAAAVARLFGSLERPYQAGCDKCTVSVISEDVVNVTTLLDEHSTMNIVLTMGSMNQSSSSRLPARCKRSSHSAP